MEYTELKALIDSHPRAKRHKLQNNTWAEYRYQSHGASEALPIVIVDCIAVRLHSTDILHFYPSGRIRIDTGGWETVTTKDRLNTYLPANLRVQSYRCADEDKTSVWCLYRRDASKDVVHSYEHPISHWENGEYVATGEMRTETYVYPGWSRVSELVDTMLVSSEGEVLYWPDRASYGSVEERERNYLIEKLVKRYLRGLTDKKLDRILREGPNEDDCEVCNGRRSTGANETYAEHLYRHLALRDYQYAILSRATTAAAPSLRGDRWAELVLNRDWQEIIYSALGLYFRGTLNFKRPEEDKGAFGGRKCHGCGAHLSMEPHDRNCPEST